MMLLTEETVDILFSIYTVEETSLREITYCVVADALKDMIEEKYHNQLKQDFDILVNKKYPISMWELVDICAKFSPSKLLRKRASKFIRMIKKLKIRIPGQCDIHKACLEYLKTGLITVNMPVLDFSTWKETTEIKQINLDLMWKQYNRYREHRKKINIK